MNINACFHSPPFTADFNQSVSMKHNVVVHNLNNEYVIDVSNAEKQIHDLVSKDKQKFFHTYLDCELHNDETCVIYRYPCIDTYIDINSFFENCVQTLSPKFAMHLLIHSFIHLCNGLELLQTQNGLIIVHGHLNSPQNIVFPDFTSCFPLICNFSDDCITQTKNICAPLECQLLQYMDVYRLKSVSEQNIEDVLEQHTHYNCNNKNETKNTCHRYLTQFINQDKEKIQHEIYQHQSTWDTYMLCMQYLSVINMFVSCDRFKMYENYIDRCCNLLTLNTCVFPEKRKSCTETRQLWIKIFAS